MGRPPKSIRVEASDTITASATGTALPRDLDTDAQIITTPEHYRASMASQLQLFKQDTRRVRQLLLTERPGDEQDDVEVYGLDLTEGQDKALSAIQILLEQTDYKGNLPARWESSSAYQGPVPMLAFTPSEYFTAYGIQSPRETGWGRQEGLAMDDLTSLTDAQRVCFENMELDAKGKPVPHIIRYTGPLVEIIEDIHLKSEAEAKDIRDGKSVAGRVRTIVVKPSVLLFSGINGKPFFYTLIPVKLHQEIRALHGQRRYPRAITLFIRWLLTLNRPHIKISKDKLIQRLWLGKYIEERHPERAEEAIKKAIQTAKDLGFLLKHTEDKMGMMCFWPSPERCSRLRLNAGEEA